MKLLFRIAIGTWTVMSVLYFSVYAQDKPQPPTRTGALPADSLAGRQEGPMPSIDLPEFMITGNDGVLAPSGTRTSVEDAKPFEPELFSTLEDREHRGTYSDRPSVVNDVGIGGVNGNARAGYSSYTTPFFDAWVGKDFTSFDLLLKGGFKSSAGFAPNTDFRSGYGAISGGTSIKDEDGIFSGARVQGSARIYGDTYNMYGSTDPLSQRTIGRFSTEAVVASNRHEFFSYVAAFRLQSTSLQSSDIRSREFLIGTDISGTMELSDIVIKPKLELWSDIYSTPSDPSNPWFGQAAASGTYRLQEDVELIGGLSFYLLRGSVEGTKAKLYPSLGVSWLASSSATVFMRFDPSVQRSDMRQLLESNPYLRNDIEIQHLEYFVDISAGTNLRLNSSLTGNIKLRYSRVRNNALYLDPQRTGEWIASYEGITGILEASFDARTSWSTQDDFIASLVMRGSNNSTSDTQVPYLPTMELSGLYVHRFLFGLSVSSTVTFTGARYADPENTRSLSSYVLLDVGAEYAITQFIKAGLSVNNIINPAYQRWEGYAGLPRTATLSLSYAW